jgi:hypothetical protein
MKQWKMRGWLSAGACFALLALACGPATAQEPAPSVVEPAAEGDITAEAMELYRLQLDFHPIGGVIPEGRLRLGNYLRMHPAGFRADEFDMYLQPTYGLGGGWEATAGITGAERIGKGGEAIFYGAGIQKQLVRDRGGMPAISLGAYGMTGPHDHHTGMLFLAATKELLWRGDRAAWLHAGLKYETFDSDDYGNGSGIRPYVGATVALSRRYTLSGEYSPKQPGQDTNMFAVRATVRMWRNVGISGGIRNNGFETHPFIGLGF